MKPTTSSSPLGLIKCAISKTVPMLKEPNASCVEKIPVADLYCALVIICGVLICVFIQKKSQIDKGTKVD